MDPTKTFLIVLRHAHAAKAETGQADYDRPLDERGRREAREAGEALLGLGCTPARIVASGSARTRETVAGLSGAIAATQTRFEDALYHDGTAAYRAAAKTSDTSSLMLVGHNPSVADFVADMSGDGEPDALRRLAEGMPPAAFALVEFRTPLSGIAAGSGFLRHLFIPSRG